MDYKKLKVLTFHVGADQHLAELDKIAMALVFDLDSAPRILAGPDHFLTNGDHLGAAYDRKWNVLVHG